MTQSGKERADEQTSADMNYLDALARIEVLMDKTNRSEQEDKEYGKLIHIISEYEENTFREKINETIGDKDVPF